MPSYQLSYHVPIASKTVELAHPSFSGLHCKYYALHTAGLLEGLKYLGARREFCSFPEIFPYNASLGDTMHEASPAKDSIVDFGACDTLEHF